MKPLLVLLLLTMTAQAVEVAPRLPEKAAIEVLPVIFIPADASLSDRAIEADALLLQAHLLLAQRQYAELLDGHTFAFRPAEVYRSSEPQAFYADAATRADRIVSQLLAWKHRDRYDADLVFLTIYVHDGPGINGGGLPLNGTAGTGGGYIELDHASLRTDRPYPFQSSLIHELGHAFGLAHSDCLGEDMQRGRSIMSYNPAHWSQGLERSATPGIFLPEERYVLSLDQRIFPGLTARPVDLARVQRCFIPPMGEGAGPYRAIAGVGFELYYDGLRVNGPDATLYSRATAEDSCRRAIRDNPSLRVRCEYNGRALAVRGQRR